MGTPQPINETNKNDEEMKDDDESDHNTDVEEYTIKNLIVNF